MDLIFTQSARENAKLIEEDADDLTGGAGVAVGASAAGAVSTSSNPAPEESKKRVIRELGATQFVEVILRLAAQRYRTNNNLAWVSALNLLSSAS